MSMALPPRSRQIIAGALCLTAAAAALYVVSRRPAPQPAGPRIATSLPTPPAGPVPAEPQPAPAQNPPIDDPPPAPVHIAGSVPGPASPAEIQYSIAKGPDGSPVLRASTAARTFTLIEKICVNLLDQRDFNGDGSTDALVVAGNSCVDCCGEKAAKLYFIAALDGKFVISEPFGRSWQRKPIVEKWRDRWSVLDITTNEYQPGAPEPLAEIRRRYVLAADGSVSQAEEVRTAEGVTPYQPRWGPAADKEEPPATFHPVQVPSLPARIHYVVDAQFLHDTLRAVVAGKSYTLIGRKDESCHRVVEERDFDGDGSIDALVQAHPGCGWCCAFNYFFVSAVKDNIVFSQSFGSTWGEAAVEKWNGQWTVVVSSTNTFSYHNPRGPEPDDEPPIEIRRRFILKDGKAVKVEEARRLRNP